MQRQSIHPVGLFFKKVSQQVCWKFLEGFCCFFLLATLVGVIGCPGKKTGLSGLPLAGQVVKVSCPGEPLTTIISRFARNWASRTGAQIEVKPYDPNVGPEDGPAADVWVIRPAELSRWAATDRILPVPQAYTSPDNPCSWPDFLPLYRDKLLLWDHTPYAMPLLGEGLLCFYRDDLFRQKENRIAFQAAYHHELEAPTTWEEFAEIAEFFHARPSSSDSLPPLSENAEELDREFYSIAAPYDRLALFPESPRPPQNEMFSFHFDLKTGRPRIASPSFINALRMLNRLQPCRGLGTTPAPAEWFRLGHGVLCLADASWIGRFQDQKSSIRNHFQFCRVPGSRLYYDYGTGQEKILSDANYIPYLGSRGWLAVVPRNAKDPETAFSLVADLSSPQVSTDIVFDLNWGGEVTRQQHFEYRQGWDAFELGAAKTITLMGSLRSSVNPTILNPVIRLRTPDERKYLQVLAEEIRLALTGGKANPEATLKKVATRWNNMDNEENPEMRRRNYRLSLGLSSEK